VPAVALKLNSSSILGVKLSTVNAAVGVPGVIATGARTEK